METSAHTYIHAHTHRHTQWKKSISSTNNWAQMELLNHTKHHSFSTGFTTLHCGAKSGRRQFSWHVRYVHSTGAWYSRLGLTYDLNAFTFSFFYSLFTVLAHRYAMVRSFDVVSALRWPPATGRVVHELLLSGAARDRTDSKPHPSTGTKSHTHKVSTTQCCKV